MHLEIIVLCARVFRIDALISGFILIMRNWCKTYTTGQKF